MASEIETKVNQKEVALINSQAKIDAAQGAIDLRQSILDRLREDHARKEADLARMQELAKAHAPLQERHDMLMARMSQIVHDHDWTDGKLQENVEYRDVLSEIEEIKPKLEQTLPAIKRIFYGKDRS
jgi:multidrug resistance efflux pump